MVFFFFFALSVWIAWAYVAQKASQWETCLFKCLSESWSIHGMQIDWKVLIGSIHRIRNSVNSITSIKIILFEFVFGFFLLSNANKISDCMKVCFECHIYSRIFWWKFMINRFCMWSKCVIFSMELSTIIWFDELCCKPISSLERMSLKMSSKYASTIHNIIDELSARRVWGLLNVAQTVVNIDQSYVTSKQCEK